MKKGEMYGLIFLGGLSAVFAVLGPLHEFWHWLFATISGQQATMYWTETAITGRINIWTAFAGMFGEVTTISFLFFLAMSKRFFRVSAYLHGYICSFIIVAVLYYTGIMGVEDVDIAIKNYGPGLPNVFYAVFNLYLVLMVIVQAIGLAMTVRGRKYLKNVQNKIKNAQKIAEIRENGYPLLTLVK